MKCKKALLSAALLAFAIGAMIYPANASSYVKPNLNSSSISYTLLPPLCFVDEMYEFDDKDEQITAEQIISDEKVEVKVKFKLFEVIKSFFGRLFR